MSDDLRRAVDDPPEETSSSLRHRAQRVHRRMHANPVLSLVSKIVIGVVGTVVLVAGIIMIVTPGPAFVLIPLGLAILATEFTWARRALEKAKEQAVKAKEKAQAQDPRVRRRNRLLLLAAVLVVVAAVAVYVAAYDWPAAAVDGWNWVQSLSGFVPELPGM